MRAPLIVAVAAAAVLAVALAGAPTGSAMVDSGPPVIPGTTSVLFVANNWDGTADIVDPQSFQKLGRFNTVPDLQERLAEINSDPVRMGYYIGIRALVGEGHDQYADDMFSSHDGRFVYISRPSLADVVGIDLKTNAIVWRFPMEGQRADHMAISPDGRRLLISDSTANKVHELDSATGKKVGEFASGDSPHENNYSGDGKLIYHASIGLVYTPADQPVTDSSKGERYFQIVEAGTNKILKRYDIGKIMADQGLGQFNGAVRPMAISPDEKKVFMQLSFLHGFIEFDLATEKVTRIAELPVSDAAKAIPREQYLLDSAHHGLAINPEGTKLCAAGTMSDYAAIVSTKTFEHVIATKGEKPYWSTNSADGKYCFISFSGSDEVAVVDYASEKEIARIPVGDHPQRMRMGIVRSELIGRLAEGARVRGPLRLHVARARRSGGALDLRLRVTSRATGKLEVAYRAAGRTARFRLAIPSGPASVQRVIIQRLTLPAAMRSAHTGTLTVSYAGSADVAPESVRLAVAPGKARLRATRARLRSGRIELDGTIASRARGSVSARLAYLGDGSRVRTVAFTARIRDGRWRVRGAVPSQARGGGQLTLVYAGDRARGLRGEQSTRRIGPDARAARPE